MSVQDFWKCTLSEVMHIIYYHRQKMEQDRRTIEDQLKTQWEIGRIIAFYGIKPHDSKKKIRRPNSLFQFPWEKDLQTGIHIPKEEAFTPEETEELDRMKEMYIAHKNKI